MPKFELEIIIILSQKTQGGSIGQNRTANSLAVAFKELVLLVENIYSTKISFEINHKKNRERFEYYYEIIVDYDASFESFVEKLSDNLFLYLCRNLEITQKRSSIDFESAFQEFIYLMTEIDGEELGGKYLESLKKNQNKIKNIVAGVTNRYSIQIFRGKIARARVLFPLGGEGHDGLFGGAEGPGNGKGELAVEKTKPKPPSPSLGGITPRPLVIMGVLNTLDFSSANKSKIKINNGQKVMIVTFSEVSFAKICRIVGDFPRSDMQFTLEKDSYSQEYIVQDVNLIEPR